MPETFTAVPAYPESSTMKAEVTWLSVPPASAAASAAAQLDSAVPAGSSDQVSVDWDAVPLGSSPNRESPLWNSITQRGLPPLAELAVIVGAFAAEGAGGLTRSTCADAPLALLGSSVTAVPDAFHAALDPVP